MVDTSKAKKEFSKSIQKVISWLDESGFDAKLTTQNTKKTAFEVEKCGVSDCLEITASRENIETIDRYLEQFRRSFEMKCEIEKLKKELAEK